MLLMAPPVSSLALSSQFSTLRPQRPVALLAWAAPPPLAATAPRATAAPPRRVTRPKRPPRRLVGPSSSRRASAPAPLSVGRAERSLAELSAALATTCAVAGLPPPHVRLPTLAEVRAADPTLANRIESVRGRNGYRRLAVYLGQAPPAVRRRKRRKSEDLRRFDDTAFLLRELRPFQWHPRVLPCLRPLPKTLRVAIRRQGGLRQFASNVSMIREGEWRNFAKFLEFIEAMLTLVHGSPTADVDNWTVRVEMESREEIGFPTSEDLRRAGLYAGVQLYGGRRALGARLGFRRQPGGIFMGSFSATFAAQLLHYALDTAIPTADGYLTMPSPSRMLADGRGDLAALSDRFGGYIDVGRRLGLVPSASAERELVRGSGFHADAIDEIVDVEAH